MFLPTPNGKCPHYVNIVIGMKIQRQHLTIFCLSAAIYQIELKFLNTFETFNKS